MVTKKSAAKAAAPKKAASTKVGPKKKVVAKVKAAPALNKKGDIQKQLEALHAKMAALNQEAVQELKAKIKNTKMVLRGYQRQLGELTGRSKEKL